MQRVAVHVGDPVLQLTLCAPTNSTTQPAEQLTLQLEVIASQRTVLPAPTVNAQFDTVAHATTLFAPS